MVTITVRPTVTRVQTFVEDPNPLLRVGPTGLPLANPLSNRVPQVQVREMESVLQLVSGQTAILGGLMQDNMQRNTDQVPGVGNIPRIGEAFQFRNDNVSKDRARDLHSPGTGQESVARQRRVETLAPVPAGNRQDRPAAMSLLLQALQKAAKNREATTTPSEPSRRRRQHRHHAPTPEQIEAVLPSLFSLDPAGDVKPRERARARARASRRGFVRARRFSQRAR